MTIRGTEAMKALLAAAIAIAMAPLAVSVRADESTHSHPAPEKLGTVHFENSCAAMVRGSFDRAVALLHSFAYEVATKEFEAVATRDPGCAMAHWGVAMTQYHQLWDAPKTAALQFGRDQLSIARKVGK